MISVPMDVLTQFPVRKSKKQKHEFINAIRAYCADLGYKVSVQKGSMGAQNIVIGNPATAKYVVTAHYDTCATLPFPNFITPRNLAAYLAYQIFVLALFFGICALISALVYLITNDPEISFWIAYLSYFGLFFLMLFGPANKHNANDNTSGVVTLLEIARTMPEIHRHKVC